MYKNYVKEAERQCNNKENYRKIYYDPTTAKSGTIHKVISRFQKENLPSKNIFEGLRTENPKAPYFYLKPNINKEDNPGRPAISSINCHTTKISEYVDYYLNQLLKKSPRISKIQKSTFLGRLTKLTVSQTTHTMFF